LACLAATSSRLVSFSKPVIAFGSDSSFSLSVARPLLVPPPSSLVCCVVVSCCLQQQLIMKFNPVLQETYADIVAWLDEYKQCSERVRWGKLVTVSSALALVVDFVVFCVFVAAVGASWSVVIALYYDMLLNCLGMLFTQNHYVLMSFVTLRLGAVLGLIGGDIYWSVLAQRDTVETLFGMSLDTWLIVFIVTSAVYLVYTVCTTYIGSGGGGGGD
jgi:hypothetical protein